MNAYCLSERTKVLLSNAFLDDTATVTRLFVMTKALVEANRVQRHLGYCQTLHICYYAQSNLTISKHLSYTFFKKCIIKNREIQVWVSYWCQSIGKGEPYEFVRGKISTRYIGINLCFLGCQLECLTF